MRLKKLEVLWINNSSPFILCSQLEFSVPFLLVERVNSSIPVLASGCQIVGEMCHLFTAYANTLEVENKRSTGGEMPLYTAVP